MIRREDIIDYFKEYESLRLDIFQRELKVPLDSDFIISIIGPRRAGKTYFLLSSYQKVEDGVYLNFEDTRLMDIGFREIREVIRIFIELYGKSPKYLFFDEIQNVPKWENIVRELYDIKKYKIFITGSSSKLLSKEIATQLRGRTLSFILLPFSFRELLGFQGFRIDKYLAKDEESKIKNLLRQYLEFGGFPDVIKSEEKIRILKEYSDLILFRDFIERHRIRNLDLARFLHAFIIQNFSREITIRGIFNKISNIKVSKNTIYEYVSKLEDTMFFFFLRKFSKKVHVRELWPKKVYLCDTGLTKVFRFTPDFGRLMENAVFIELLRKRNENPLIEVYYLRINNKEVDFLIKEGLNIKQLIQVTYASSKDEIERREIKSLLKAYELFKENNPELIVITWDYEDTLRIDNKEIKFIPLWKWLL